MAAAASPPAKQTPSSAVNLISSTAVSHFKKTVTLQEWWLIKADKDYEGRRLGVAGFALSGQRGRREFHSAPIIKTYNFFTLETADGVTVLLYGAINQTRTLQNGFPPEVFNHFLLGFPLYPEQYVKRWVEVATTNEVDLKKTSADADVQSTGAVSTPIADKDEPNAEARKESPFLRSIDEPNAEASKESPFLRSIKLNAKALKSLVTRSILHSPVTRSRSSACEKVNSEKHSSVEGTCDAVHHDGSRALQSSSSANLAISKMASKVATSSYNVGSPERVDNLESNRRRKERSVKKLKRKDPVVLENATFISSSAPEGGSGLETSDADHLNVLGVNQKKASNSYESLRDGYGLRSGVTSKSPASLPQVPELTSGFDGEKERGTSASPDAGDLSNPELDQNNGKCTMMDSLVQSRVEAVVDTLPVAESVAMSVNPNFDGPVDLKHQANSSSKRRRPRTRSLKANYYLPKKKASGSAVKQNKELASESAKPHLDEEGKLDGTVHKETCNSEVGASRRTKNSTRKERHQKLSVKDGDSSGTTKAKRKIRFETPVTPNTLEGKSRSCLRSPESLNLKRSRSGRLLLPTLHSWGNQVPVYDRAGNFTGILEQLDTVGQSQGSRSEPQKKKRKTR